jgi:hypothetical protein
MVLARSYLRGSYVSRIMVFDPADPYHPTIFEVPGYIYADDIIANADGSALVRLSRVSWKLRWRSPARDLPCGRCRAFRQELREQGDHHEEE